MSTGTLDSLVGNKNKSPQTEFSAGLMCSIKGFLTAGIEKRISQLVNAVNKLAWFQYKLV